MSKLEFITNEATGQLEPNVVAYDRVNWVNDQTRLNAENMNVMDEYIEYLSSVTSYLAQADIQLNDVVQKQVTPTLAENTELLDKIYTNLGLSEANYNEETKSFSRTISGEVVDINDAWEHIVANTKSIAENTASINGLKTSVEGITSGLPSQVQAAVDAYVGTQFNNYYTKTEIDAKIGDIETLLGAL